MRAPFLRACLLSFSSIAMTANAQEIGKGAGPGAPERENEQQRGVDGKAIPAISYDITTGGRPDRFHSVAIEITPLGLFLGHYGGSLEILPSAHHALVLSAFYSQTTGPDPDFIQPDPKNPVGVPTNAFKGVGGEVGYRYYFGQNGPHGLYLGPSLLLGSYRTDLHTTTFASSRIDFHDIGGALDIGFQAIVGDCILMGIGAGAQYVHVDKNIPDQGDILSNQTVQSAVRPRASLTLGYAF